MVHHRKAALLLVLALAACGRTTPSESFPLSGPLAVGDAGVPADAECLENAQCDEDAVCIGFTCVYFGQCLRDWHCPRVQTCVANECQGEITETSGEGLGCEINSDCPERHYCVDELCRRGVECVAHAHCSAGSACLSQLCISAL